MDSADERVSNDRHLQAVPLPRDSAGRAQLINPSQDARDLGLAHIARLESRRSRPASARPRAVLFYNAVQPPIKGAKRGVGCVVPENAPAAVSGAAANPRRPGGPKDAPLSGQTDPGIAGMT
jgi:hypothetical protein